MADLESYPQWCSELFGHCVENVRRYKHLQKAFTSFPIIGKSDILADYSAFIAGNLGVSPQELAVVLTDEQRKRASISEGSRWRHIVIEETSGTSGIPFNFPKTVAERAMAACEIWKWRRTIDPHVTIKTFYPFLHAPIGFAHPFSPFDISSQNVANLYAHLTLKGTRWVHGPPELLRQHAAALGELVSHEIGVKFFETTGIYLSEEARSGIEEIGGTVVNQYGCREAWVIGYGVGTSNEFEVLTQNVFVELVDSSGHAISDPEIVGDIVVTARFARLMPFVRYRTGDRGRWACKPTGRKLHLVNTEREPGAWRWGRWGSGSRFFRIMLSRAYMQTGYIPMRVLQIREAAECRFAVFTDDIPRRYELCRALEAVCASDAPPTKNRRFEFSSHVIDDSELNHALAEKPRLFRPALDTSLSSAAYFLT